MQYTRTPFRQLARLYEAVLSGASSLKGIHQGNATQATVMADGLERANALLSESVQQLVQKLDVQPAHLGANIDRLESAVRGIKLQSAAQSMDELRSQLAASTPGNPVIQGWGSYSQCDEDGIIRECLRRIGLVAPLSKTFIEIGCGNGLENNTHQLSLDGFAGCWLDGDWSNIGLIAGALGALETPGLLVRQAFVTLESISDIVSDCTAFLGTSDIDFFSLDTDGNDTHLVRKALRQIRPKLVCVEYNAKFRPPTAVEIPYDASHMWAGDDYFGGSLQTWVELLAGYSLVGCNLSGANAFFVRDDLMSPFVRYDVQALYQPPRYWLASHGSGHSASMKWLRQAVSGRCIDHPWVLQGRVPHVPSFDFEIHRHGDQFISTQLARTNNWEPFETEVLRRLCRPGDFVLDIGANIGWYSVIASKLIGATGRLLSFEPDPDNFAMLRRNIARCVDAPHTELRHEAVSEGPGKIKLFLSDINRGDHRIFDDGTQRESIEVPMDSLDTILADESRLPDLVKSDTQGSEARILRGARGLFARGWRPVLVLEFWPFGLRGSGDDPLALWSQLLELDYQMFEVTEDRPHLFPLATDRISTMIAKEISAESGAFINILAVPQGSQRLAAVEELIVPL